jgi:quercetin dioxygenase-like cupin family protein
MRYLSLTLVGSLFLVTGCGGAEPAAEEYPDAVTADPAHYAVEFENDVVRILRITYGPGEESVMHHHPETCSIALTGGSWRMTDPNGEATEEDPTAPGDLACDNPASVHLPANTGDSDAELILVERKEGATAGSAPTPEHPDAVSADPDHYAVEFENDVARVIRISYGAGEESVLHHHPANCYVPLHSGTWHMANAEGEVTEIATEYGQVVCGDADSHLPSNASGEAVEAVLIEFKGRQTVRQ